MGGGREERGQRGCRGDYHTVGLNLHPPPSFFSGTRPEWDERISTRKQDRLCRNSVGDGPDAEFVCLGEKEQRRRRDFSGDVVQGRVEEPLLRPTPLEESHEKSSNSSAISDSEFVR